MVSSFICGKYAGPVPLIQDFISLVPQVPTSLSVKGDSLGTLESIHGVAIILNWGWLGASSAVGLRQNSGFDGTLGNSSLSGCSFYASSDPQLWAHPRLLLQPSWASFPAMMTLPGQGLHTFVLTHPIHPRF